MVELFPGEYTELLSEVRMSKRTEWALIVGALISGVAGGVLAAKVAMPLFWVGWLLAIGLLGFCIYKTDRQTEPATSSSAPDAVDNDSAGNGSESGE